MTPTNLTARIEAMINESTDAHENGDNTVSALSVALLLLDVQAHLAQSPLRESPAPFDWTDPGHRLTEGDLDAAEETYMGETVKSGTYRHRAALEAVIRGYLASNRAEAEPLTVPGPEIPPIGHPLQVLGGRLADLLDEDQWNNAEPLLLAAWKLCRTQPEAALALTWTMEKPKVPGWYWYHQDGVKSPGISEVFPYIHGRLCMYEGDGSVIDLIERSQWSGPIPQPLTPPNSGKDAAK